MGIKQLREEEKGSGLVLTLMVLLVLSILGVAIGTLTIGSYRLSDATRDDTSAYYVAEAGAVAAYEEIQKEVLNAYDKNATKGAFFSNVSTILTSKNGKSKVDFGTQFGNKPTATIKTEKLTGTDSQTSTIYSTGEVDGKQRSVSKELTVKWVDKNTGGGMPKIPAKTALYVNEEIKLLGGTLEGNGYIQSINNNSVQIGTYGSFRESTLHYSNQTTPDKLISYPDYMKDKLPNLSNQIENINFQDYGTVIEQIRAPKITEKLPFKKIGTHTVQDEDGNLNITSQQAKGYELKLESDVYIPKIESKSQISFSVNTGGSDHTILVDRLDIGGDIKIEGEGTLTIFIKDLFNINSGGISFNKNGTPSKLILVYLGDSDLKLENNIKINGHMLVKKANVNVNSIPINGVFLTGGKSVKFSGGTANSNVMLIAPNAEVSLEGSYIINGSVIANKFMMNGRTELIYAPIVTTGFPFGSTESTADSKPEDIINSGTILED